MEIEERIRVVEKKVEALHEWLDEIYYPEG